MRRVYEKNVNGKKLIIFGTIKGLSRERYIIRRLYELHNPDIILLAISPEELVGLEKYLEDPVEIEPDDYDTLYAYKLKQFGEVGLPIPTYLEAFALKKRHGVELMAIDIPDEDYTNLYLEKVNVLHLIRYNLRKKKVAKKTYSSKTSVEFVLKWDKEINKLRPYREIEIEREKYMANKIREILNERDEKTILAVVELERLHGVLENLNLLHTT